MLRHNHYETAFAAYLRGLRCPYVAVDESRRALLADASLKSMDFIVYSGVSSNLLVDVKGRRFPSGTAGHRWENWATEEDVSGLLQWQQVFGAGFRGLLVFAYDILETATADFSDCFEHKERTYAFFGVWADEFALAMRHRSSSWGTYSLPSAVYRDLRHPVRSLL